MAGRPVHVGCSGWVYSHWRGHFYPKGVPQRSWLSYYADHFDTVEVNSTFYRLASPTAAELPSPEKAAPEFRPRRAGRIGKMLGGNWRRR